MPPEEGGLIGYNVDTSTMKTLLDLAEKHALRSDTSLNIKLTRSETRKEAQESIRLEALAAVEQPNPKTLAFTLILVILTSVRHQRMLMGQLCESTVKSGESSGEEERLNRESVSEALCGEKFARESMSVLGDADACSEEVDIVVSEY